MLRRHDRSAVEGLIHFFAAEIMMRLIFDQDGKVKYVLGSPGGSAIISYVAQSVVALIDWGLDPQQVAHAIDEAGYQLVS